MFFGTPCTLYKIKKFLLKSWEAEGRREVSETKAREITIFWYNNNGKNHIIIDLFVDKYFPIMVDTLQFLNNNNKCTVYTRWWKKGGKGGFDTPTFSETETTWGMFMNELDWYGWIQAGENPERNKPFRPFLLVQVPREIKLIIISFLFYPGT